MRDRPCFRAVVASPVIGEVERKTGRLLREMVRVIDGRKAGGSPRHALSKFSAREDRETGAIVVNLSGLFDCSTLEPQRDWTAGAWLYRVGAR